MSRFGLDRAASTIVLEYAAPAWHHLINRTHAQNLESVQKRAIHIIFNFTRSMSYPNVLFVAQLESLETRRNNLSRSFFSRYLQTNLMSHSTSPRYLRYQWRRSRGGEGGDRPPIKIYQGESIFSPPQSFSLFFSFFSVPAV